MTVEIHGLCEERFKPLEEAFRANFDDGLELGASLGVTHHGRMVVDLWAGWKDVERTHPWEKDTIVLVASTTKMMVTLAALVLLDRGLLDLDAPIARYWPEFAQGGKGAVTVRDAFTHQAGVPGYDPPVAIEALYDWAGITAHIAAEPHWFGGERVIAYHASTYGFVLGELIRRIDGRMPGTFFREEIAEKANADFHIGVSAAEFGRLAALQMPIPPEVQPSLPPVIARVGASLRIGAPDPWDYMSAQLPSENGCGNGRSIARLCAILAMGGELDNVRYLSRATVEAAASEQAYGVDDYLGLIRFGLGYGLHSEGFSAPSPTAFHWGGHGGSWGMMDMATEISVGYAPNNWIVDPNQLLEPRQQRYFSAMEALLPTLAFSEAEPKGS
ncbi:MAG TPA: serine hydrolase domain-containing protein [Caulobacteraceae bacterium]|nr:serine hydrolase domain-containing protein [Caulobacteraceae bacterium]